MIERVWVRNKGVKSSKIRGNFTSTAWFASGCVAEATAPEAAAVDERLRLVGRGMFLCFQYRPEEVTLSAGMRWALFQSSVSKPDTKVEENGEGQRVGHVQSTRGGKRYVGWIRRKEEGNASVIIINLGVERRIERPVRYVTKGFTIRPDYACT